MSSGQGSERVAKEEEGMKRRRGKMEDTKRWRKGGGKGEEEGIKKGGRTGGKVSVGGGKMRK